LRRRSVGYVATAHFLGHGLFIVEVEPCKDVEQDGKENRLQLFVVVGSNLFVCRRLKVFSIRKPGINLSLEVGIE
ncbi:UNVERIFIED_CONTAM: hypothetical protein NY100_34535, partial [Prevotella sp. 15_C9]